MVVHDCHDENGIGGRPIEKRAWEPGNDDTTNTATERPTNFGKVLNLGLGSLDEYDEILSQISRLGLVARCCIEKLRQRVLVELDSDHRSFERTSAMTWSAGTPLA